MSESNGYFSDTVSTEEAKQLAELSAKEAQKLDDEIFQRTLEKYPAVAERMSSPASDFFKAVALGDKEPVQDPRLGKTITEEDERALAKAIAEAGF